MDSNFFDSLLTLCNPNEYNDSQNTIVRHLSDTLFVRHFLRIVAYGKMFFHFGDVSEWSIVHPWKGCVESNQPEVRILSSPKLFIIHL